MRHYIVATFALADIPLTEAQVSDLVSRGVIERVPDQPADDGQVSYYVNGQDAAHDQRILEREGLWPVRGDA